MTKSSYLFISLSVLILSVSGTHFVMAKDKPPRDSEMSIINVLPEYDSGLLIIAGQNFPADGNLVVELGGGLMALTSVTPDTIVAMLPPNFPDGDYLLTVTDGKSYVEYDLTINDTTKLQSTIDACAEGFAIREINADGSVVCESFLPATSTGTIKIESIGGDVTILAGATSVTVKPDGTVEIKGQTLNLTGNEINMKAATKINMTATAEISMKSGGSSIKINPSTMDMDATLMNLDAAGSLNMDATLLNLDASGFVDIDGGIITLN